MSVYIPVEIQAEILKRLPVKPLIRFRSVSKPWKCLIDSPGFIVSYDSGHPQPSDDRFIFRYQLPYYPYEFRYISLVDNGDHGFVRQELIPAAPDLIKKKHYLVGSSHGLLCLKAYCEDRRGYPVRIETLLLWNPSIRKSIGIQVPYMCDSPNFGDVRVDNEVFGFGVCPATFEPTILRIECLVRTMKNVPWKVQVFTLSTGCWSILSTNLPRESIRLEGYQVVIDRFIYWVAYDMLDDEGDSSSQYLIMSFDLTAKEFKEINLPDSLTNRNWNCLTHTISKLWQSLVLLAYHGDGCLWMMMEQGVSRSFTKLYTINLPGATIYQIVGFKKTGELILDVRPNFSCNANFLIYNPNSEAIDNLWIDGIVYCNYMGSYMGTLLLLNQ